MEVVHQIWGDPPRQPSDEESRLQRPAGKSARHALLAAGGCTANVLLDIWGLDGRYAVTIGGHEIPLIVHFVIQAQHGEVLVGCVGLRRGKVCGPQAITTGEIVRQRHCGPGCRYRRANVNAKPCRSRRTAGEARIESTTRNSLAGVWVTRERARINRRDGVQVVRDDVAASVLEFKNTSPQGCGGNQPREHRLGEEMALFFVQEEESAVLPDRSADLPPVAVVPPFGVFNRSTGSETIVSEPVVGIQFIILVVPVAGTVPTIRASFCNHLHFSAR